MDCCQQDHREECDQIQTEDSTASCISREEETAPNATSVEAKQGQTSSETEESNAKYRKPVRVDAKRNCADRGRNNNSGYYSIVREHD